jgi:hypothetical protein
MTEHLEDRGKIIVRYSTEIDKGEKQERVTYP